MAQLSLMLVLLINSSYLQQSVVDPTVALYTTGESVVRFFSHAPLEDIEASSTKLRGAANMETGQLLFVIPVSSFKFEKALMQKHFNEQYLETDKFPEARFEGNFNESPIEVNGSRTIPFKGRLTLHGVTRSISGEANLTRKADLIYGESTFKIKLEDYNIKIPRMVIKNIAEVVEVTIKSEFQPDINP
jgi:polyisoprenoid-binding protein YceI